MLMTEFEMSVRESKGLTDYRLGALPKWLSTRLIKMFVGDDDGATDADLVERFVRGDWLRNWGAATIDGKEVFVFDYRHENIFQLCEPAWLAEVLYCGLTMVEPSRDYFVTTTALFTEHRALFPRDRAGTALAVNSRG
jgi:hypothetical protein